MNPYRKLMEDIGPEHGIDPFLLEAISFVESSWKADAFRYEPGYYERYIKGNPRFRGEVPRRVASSYGLLQVMYPTALEHGFSDEPEALFIPRTNITVGCRVLRRLLTWAEGDLTRALAAYNGGRGNYKAAQPQQYARKVLAHYQQLREANDSIERNVV